MKSIRPQTHQFGNPKDALSKVTKLYSLSYRGQVYVNGAAYPVCVAKKKELMRTGAFYSKAFKITLRK